MHFSVGMLAHVDAGKTTFCEQLLYQTKAIRTPGRVDHADAFMDDHPLERQRGITIFSAQAAIEAGGNVLQLVDTPGHADFSAEMERAVSVIDAAVLLISCAEGVQAHTRTVWKVLRQYNVPVCIFLNKTDRAGADPDGILAQLREEFSSDIVDMRRWPEEEAFAEETAGRDEALLERYLGGDFEKESWLRALSGQFRRREIFPVLAGSALQGTGVSEALDLLSSLLSRFPDPAARANEPLSARVYKVRADHSAGRLVYMKLLSGTLSARDKIGPDEEKVTNLYSVQGGRLAVLDRAVPGMLCAAAGLSARAGDVLGAGAQAQEKALMPMLRSTGRRPPSCSPPCAFWKTKTRCWWHNGRKRRRRSPCA
ncbi:MAG: GTP-binding protein [Eubacteriales bacterium]|nr:GTP-binding protein [Eubacteriales bacterium]